MSPEAPEARTTNKDEVKQIKLDIPASHAKVIVDEVTGLSHAVREYRAVQLKDGLQCMLVRDVATEKAALSTTVYPAGQLHDGPEWPGRAHLLEHLLFLGSTAFPVENELDAWLTQHGGHSNAYTDLELTCYYMDFSTAALGGTLQRWAAALSSPLLSESVVEREIRAVDSEHAKNKPADYWRIYQLSKTLLAESSGENHPYGHFGSGCLASLLPGASTKSESNETNSETAAAPAGEGDGAVPTPATTETETDDDPAKAARITALRKAVYDFWQLHYVASNITISVLSSLPLDEQEALVRTHFEGKLPTGSATATIPVIPPLSLRTGCRRIDMIPIRPVYTLELHWPLREIGTLYQEKPTQVLSHLLGDEGPGSLLHVLRHEQPWVQELSADHGSRSTSAFSVFILQMELTPVGCQHVEDIIALVYAYIRLIANAPLPTHIYDEVKTVGDMAFEFMGIPSSATDTVSSLTVQMHSYKDHPEHYLSGLYKYFAPQLNDETLHKEFVQYLTPANMLWMVGAPDLQQQPSPEHAGPWQTDTWYGTQYRVTSMDVIPESWTCTPHHLADMASELHLPEPNEFMPTDFALIDQSSMKRFFDQADAPPVCILNSTAAQLWYKPDTAFQMPKVNIFCSFPLPHSSSSVMSSLWAEWQNEVTNTFAYAASMAGLHGEWVANPKRCTLELHVSGYSCKATLFAQRFLETTVQAKTVEPELWERLVQKMHDQYQSFLKMAQVYQHASHHLDQCLEAVPTPVSVEERMAQLERFTAQDMIQFHQAEFLSSTGIQVLVHGNITPEQAMDWAQTIPNVLKQPSAPEDEEEEQDSPAEAMAVDPAPPLTTTQHTLQQRIVQLPPQAKFLFRGKSWSDENTNHCTVQYYPFGIVDLETNATLSLLRQLINEPAFNQLRTQEQLGYIVSSQLKTSGDHVKALVLLVQGEVQDPVYMEQRMLAFWKQVRTQLAEMTEEEFASHRQALYHNFMERKKNLLQESAAHWNVITNQSYHFTRIVDVGQFLLTRTKQHVLRLIDKCILYGSSLTIQMFGRDSEIPSTAGIIPAEGEPIMVDSPIEFGRTQSLYALPPTVPVKVVDLFGTNNTDDNNNKEVPVEDVMVE